MCPDSVGEGNRKELIGQSDRLGTMKNQAHPQALTSLRKVAGSSMGK